MSVEPPALTIIGNRYQLLDKIGEGGMGAVYHAVDRLDGSTVALKRVTTPGEQLQFMSRGSSADFRLALAQEFRVLASLRHPNIISVLDYGFDADHQPYFTMELLKNAQTLKAHSSGRTAKEHVALLRQILEALAYLHRQGILHRDLKPDNLLVIANNSMSGGQVKVLDFGLAVAREALREDEETVGTLAYMAPEVLSGGSPSEASDLYAFGVIAYELLSGHHPFPAQNLGELVQAVLNRTADVGSIPVDKPLKEMLDRLLAKLPDRRFRSTSELLSIVAQYSGDSAASETPSIRESYLQAAKFVGREQELDKLTGALNKMIGGQGSAWLIGGESGVGKSRLLDELWTQALVSGALALRGQAIAEGGAPYQLWREALRRLCLQTEFTELEASVLKPLVPDIGALIGREVADAPEIDARASQDRLLTVIEAVLRRQKQPIVLLLEDLQWASESLIVLKYLSEAVAELSLLIVANYRDDERPNLPDELPAMQRVKLTRLDAKAIGDLSVSMLGETGRQPQVIDLLQRETEGNVFFIVEVVRALAEEAGQLAEIGRMTLPQSVFAGGVLTVVQRRLGRVPAGSRPLLRIAAVAGRELDLAVLRAAAPDTEIDPWLTSVFSVIDVQDNRYRFAHDKLREGLLQNLSAERHRALNKTVAEAVAIAHPDDPAQYAILHYHWEEAGEGEKARHYAELGGETALKNGVAPEAVRLLTRALELQSPQVEQTHLGHLRRLLGQAQLSIGETRQAETTLQQAGIELGYPLLIHAPAWRRALDSFYQFARQVPQFVGWQPKKLEGHKQNILSEAMKISWPFDRISQLLSYGPLDLMSMRLRYANWAARAEASVEQANADSVIAILFAILSIPSLAEFYLKRAQQTADLLENPLTDFYIVRVVNFTAIRVGNWARAIELAKLALPLVRRVGDTRVEAESVSVVVSTAFFAGNFREANDAIRELEALGTSRRDEGILAYGFIFQAMLSFWQDAPDMFAACVARLEQLAIPDDGASSHSVFSLKGLFYWREGRMAEATASIEAAILLLEAMSAPLFPYYHFITELARTCERMAEQGESREIMQNNVVHLVRVLRKMQRLFSFAEPGYHLYNGLAAWYVNRPNQAHQRWQKSLTTARKWHMPYDEARALQEIGAHFTPGDPRREENLKAAAGIYERLGAEWELKQVRQTLEQSAV